MEDNFKILYEYSKQSYKPELYSNIYRGFNRDTTLLPKEKEFVSVVKQQHLMKPMRKLLNL